MTFYSGTIKALKYLVLAPTSINKDVRRLEALLRQFRLRSTRIHKVSLDFGKNIIERPVGWTIAGLAPYLLTTICGQAQTALFVVNNGLFTCKPKALVRWNPYTRDQYYKMNMHDGTRQWVPSIRSIESLDVTYPVCTTLAPMSPWTMVVVNWRSLHTLLLSIKLSAPEWSAILPAIYLPHLREVGIWAEEISATVSTAFLNRHQTLTTLKYMSPVAEALSTTDKALVLSRLQHLTALAHYIIHTCTFTCTFTRFLQGNAPPASPFPVLTHVELFPDACFHGALRLLSLHAPLTQLTLWFIAPALMPPIFPIPTTHESPPAWPIFPRIDALALNKYELLLGGGDEFEELREDSIYTGAARLPAFVAHVFPGLRTLELNHTFPKNAGTQAENHAIWKRKGELVKRIARANVGVQRYYVDKEFFAPP